jgi:hypothetical protein
MQALSSTTPQRLNHYFVFTALESTEKRQILIVSSARFQRKQAVVRLSEPYGSCGDGWIGLRAKRRIAVVIPLRGDFAVAKSKKHGDESFHFAARGQVQHRNSQFSGPLQLRS